jgi:hypothetical protein
MLVAIALLWVGMDFAASAHADLDLMDEGYVWYGVWRTALGEVPILDFQGYDPGRYYWGALWVWMFGDGIVAMRLSGAVLKLGMVVTGLLFLRRVVASRWVLAGVALVATLWAFRLERCAGYLVAVALVAVGAWLLEHPTLRRHFAAGIFVGLAAVVGRNHGVYCLAALTLLIVLPPAGARHGLAPRAGVFAVGVVLGYAPVLLMLALVPGFAAAFMADLGQLAAAGFSNIPRAVPWPWSVDYAGLGPVAGVHAGVVGLFYILLLAVPLAAAVHLGLRARSNGWTHTPQYAAVAGAAVYAHYGFARADMSHLADAMQPLLLLLVVLPCTIADSRWRRSVGAACGTVLVLAFGAMVAVHPAVVRLAFPESFRPVEVRGDVLWLYADRAREVADVRRTVGQLAPGGEAVLFAPHRPGMYLVVDRPSPLRTIYFLGRKTEPEDRMIARLEAERPIAALVTTTAIDGRADLTLRAQYPTLYGYLETHYRRDPAWRWGLPSYYEVFSRPRSPGPGPP